jgi:hypothetical protein
MFVCSSLVTTLVVSSIVIHYLKDVSAIIGIPELPFSSNKSLFVSGFRDLQNIFFILCMRKLKVG